MAESASARSIRFLAGAVSRLFVVVLGALPLPWARFLGRCFGHAAYWCVPRIRRVGLSNLDLALGDALSRTEKLRIVRGAAENMGIVAAEFGHLPRLYRDGFDRHVRIEGAEHLDTSSGVLFVGAHFGNWEWMPAGFQHLGYEIAVVYRPLDDPALDQFIARKRGAGGVMPVPKSYAGPELVRRLREGWAVGILVDQSPRENAVPITFFGKRTWATAAPVLLAMRARVPIHPSYLVRRPSGDYTMVIGRRIELERSGNTRADLLENTQRCHAALEDTIREHPDHWLWFHRRWKPRPRLEEAWTARERRRPPETLA